MIACRQDDSSRGMAAMRSTSFNGNPCKRGMNSRRIRVLRKSARPARAKKSGRPLPPGASQIRLLRQSFAKLEPQAGIAGLIFYRNLFELDPNLRALFQTSIELQARKLMESLSFTIATLENPAELAPLLESMGRRHVTYGAQDRDYATVIEALLKALEEVLGNSFAADVRKAWREALEFVAGEMKRGARRSVALTQQRGRAALPNRS